MVASIALQDGAPIDVIRKALLRERPGPREIGSDGGVSLQNEPARQIDQRKPDPVQQNRSAG